MTKPSLLRRIFGGIWNAITWVRLALTNLLFIAMLAIIYFVYLGGTPEPLPDRAALLLNPVGSIVDQKRPVDPFVTLMGEPSPADNEVLVRDVIEAIELATEDPAINSLVMEMDGLMRVGISRSMEIAAALDAFKAAGKPVIALADFYTQDQYFLASHADEVISHPMGGVAMEGYGAYFNYFAEALDKLSVNVHVFRAGKFKSAMEPFTRNDMSPEEREVAQVWLDDLWARYASVVEAQRGLPPGAVNDYVNGFAERMVARGGDSGVDAISAGLVDRLMGRTEANTYLVETVGATDDEGLYQAVAFEYYLSRKRNIEFGASDDRVAVITAQGNILPGEQPPGTIGGDSLAQLINNTASDERTRAIVLRVNSGGGSMFASEIIREQVLAARAAGIPVVASMGAVAASGGYYIAADADEIWATPTTVTGSIGVFAAFPTFEELLQRLGVHTDGVGTTDLAGSIRVDRPLSPDLVAALNAGVGHAYQEFLKVVAEGRAMTMEEVAAVAEGRVWSATDALEVGLVDHLGGLDQAIAAAAARADIEDYRVDYIQPRLSPSELFWQQLSERVSLSGLFSGSTGDSVAVLRALSQPLLNAAAEVASLQDPRHLYFRCMGCSALD